jgi:hypothetical protein
MYISMKQQMRILFFALIQGGLFLHNNGIGFQLWMMENVTNVLKYSASKCFKCLSINCNSNEGICGNFSSGTKNIEGHN